MLKSKMCCFQLWPLKSGMKYLFTIQDDKNSSGEIFYMLPESGDLNACDIQKLS